MLRFVKNCVFLTNIINNCNRCHQLYSPDKLSAKRWEGIIAQMSPKTTMTASEVELVSKYLKKGK
ncbi:MAG: hypothetical protein ACERKD_14515 [Prolixibacteraceae bacterium]